MPTQYESCLDLWSWAVFCWIQANAQYQQVQVMYLERLEPWQRHSRSPILNMKTDVQFPELTLAELAQEMQDIMATEASLEQAMANKGHAMDEASKIEHIAEIYKYCRWAQQRDTISSEPYSDQSEESEVERDYQARTRR